MILLWGTMDDDPMAMLHAALMRAGAEHFFLDHGKICTSEIDWQFDGSGDVCTVTVDQTALDVSAVNVAYLRGSNLYNHDDLQGESANARRALRAASFETQLIAWLDSSDAVVINRSGPSAANNSKPFQLAAIAQAGFLVPDTFVSNDPEAVRRFLCKHPDAVYKSISGVRSIVRKVEDRQRGYIDDVRWCPTLFQQFVGGTNYRAHVIADRVFAVRIESDSVDYRYGRTELKAVELPPDVAERCRRLTASLELNFSGIDLMQTPQGRWYCFEVNPSPAYSYFETAGGQPIAAALAEFIIARDAASP
jgi:glutathione synthase/RimK-type ligase-like ATP-grasp enzyme